MTTEVRSLPSLSKGLVYGLGLAFLWAALAFIFSTTTYHLAPVIVAAAPAIVDASERRGSPARHALAAALGVVMALIVTGVLSVSGSLDGPSLLPSGGAALESVVFSAAGGLAGFVGAVFVSRR
ncbi:MAG: hypothetical protein U9N56_09320 [Actinomycetota bacterium]|nr:hypothetical protein [Actinomycetota bacterium]